MVQKRLVLLAAIFAAARSQALVGGELGGAHVARYLRGREDEEAPALHYFATDDPEWKYVAVRRTASEPVELFDVASESDKPVARFAFEGEPPEIYAGATEYGLHRVGRARRAALDVGRGRRALGAEAHLLGVAPDREAVHACVEIKILRRGR